MELLSSRIHLDVCSVYAPVGIRLLQAAWPTSPRVARFLLILWGLKLAKLKCNVRPRARARAHVGDHEVCVATSRDAANRPLANPRPTRHPHRRHFPRDLIGTLLHTVTAPTRFSAFPRRTSRRRLRFTTPVELHDTPWPVPREATSFGVVPSDRGVFGTKILASSRSSPFVPKPSEDCLFVNVWRPSAPQPPSPTPVPVGIHGGGFAGGAASINRYDGAKLAAQNNITVVSLNYRLGPLGFFASTELKSKYGATGGMNGLRDQLTALKWVKKHISSFGGDPSKVTVSGESSVASPFVCSTRRLKQRAS